MSKYNKSTATKCPYYIGDDAFHVRCVGVETDNYIDMTWANRQDKKEYFHACCCDDWKCCPLAMMQKHEFT